MDKLLSYFHYYLQYYHSHYQLMFKMYQMETDFVFIISSVIIFLKNFPVEHYLFNTHQSFKQKKGRLLRAGVHTKWLVPTQMKVELF